MVVNDMDTPKRKYKKHKEGYTISVDYFLKKDKSFLEAMFEGGGKDPSKFPLYVRVTFLGQNVKIKSRIKALISESDYIDFSKYSDIQRLMRIESDSIRQSIKSLNPDRVENFLISTWAQHYKKWDKTINECIGHSMGRRLENGLKVEFSLPDDEATEFLLLSSRIYPGGINYYTYLNSKTALQLQNEMKCLDEIPLKATILYKSDEVSFQYSYWDWQLELYRETVKQSTNEQSFKYFQGLMTEFELLTDD